MLGFIVYFVQQLGDIWFLGPSAQSYKRALFSRRKLCGVTELTTGQFLKQSHFK